MKKDSRIRQYEAWKAAYDKHSDDIKIAKHTRAPDGYIFGHPVWLPTLPGTDTPIPTKAVK
jgi:hypothetical protein